MKYTWLDDPPTERILHSTFENVDKDFSTFFEANPKSDEELLTGTFVQILIQNCRSLNKLLTAWGKKFTSKPWYIRFYFEDMATDNREKIYGADLAFTLNVKVPNKYERQKAILLQAKKMSSQTTNSGIIFENKWRIDINQAKNLLKYTNGAYHILYNPKQMGIRILPTASLISITKATKTSTVLHHPNTIKCTRKFPDFLLYDFIGCWAGDSNKKLLKIANGYDDDKVPNHIIRAIITDRPGVLD